MVIRSRLSVATKPTLGFALLLVLHLPQFAGAETLQFNQLDMKLDGVTYNSTEWGRVDVTFNGTANLPYLNLNINGSWQVQNVPLSSWRGVGQDQSLSFYVDLGTPRGTDVTSLNFGYSLTADPLTSAPAITGSASVAKDSFVQYSDTDTGGVPTALAPAGPSIGGPVTLEGVPHDHHVAFPNQEADKNECVPAAVSNSLQYLKAMGKINVPNNQTTIEFAKTITNWGPNGSPTDLWWKTKRDWGNAHGITTQKVSVVTPWLLGQLQDKQDVEMIYGWTDADGNKHSHAVALIDMVEWSSGWTLYVADDTDQDDRHRGCHVRPMEYLDRDFRMFAPGFGWRDFTYAVVECPEPATLSLLALGGLSLMLRRRTP